MPIFFYAARDQKFLDFKPDTLTARSLAELFDAPEKVIEEIPADERHGVYYGLAETKEPRRKDPVDPETGKTKVGAWAKEKWVRQEVLAWDLDGIKEEDRAKVSAYQDIVAGVLGVDPADMTVVASGHGFHFLVWLRAPITDFAFFKKQRIFYRACLDKIDAAILAAGLSGAGDPAIFDHNRVLRLPGTENRKREPFQLCRLIQHSRTRHDVDLRALSGLPTVGEGEVVEREVYAHRKLDVVGILTECLVLRSAREEPGSVKEPLGYAALSVLGRLDVKREIAREYLSRWTSSSSLMSTDPDKKIDQALAASGPRTCKSFENLSPKCLECKWRGKITSPILIQSENFVETEEDGFWREVNVNGKLVHRPAYDDMLKVFKRETHYFLKPETDALWLWPGPHYSRAHDAEIRNWCEKKTRPQLSQAQRAEFMAKLKSNQLMTEEAFEPFRARCRGKLNMQNGVLDTRTGELEPHSPDYGFKGVIPYSYDPSAKAPNFEKFIETVMRGNTDLMATLYDLLGASLMPGYDEMDAAFWWLSGSGSNGKTTYTRVHRGMLGERNCLALQPRNFSSQDRFALSALEGKLLAITEEVNDKHLNDDMLGVLKNLSDGGTINVEEKGKPHYNLRNTAKFVFTSNKSPVLEDVTEGLQRRFIIVPFDVNFEEPQWAGKKDPMIAEKLLAELPGILNLALDALAKLRSRGGKALKPAASRAELDAMVLQSDSVERWAREHLRVTQNPEHSILSREAFAAYQAWMGDEKCVSETTFVTRIRKKTHSEIRAKHPQIRLAGEKKRVIWGVQLVDTDDTSY